MVGKGLRLLLHNSTCLKQPLVYISDPKATSIIRFHCTKVSLDEWVAVGPANL